MTIDPDGPCHVLGASGTVRPARAGDPLFVPPPVDPVELDRRSRTDLETAAAPSADRVTIDAGEPRAFLAPGDNMYARAVRLENRSAVDVAYDADVTFRVSGGPPVEGGWLGVPPQPSRSLVLPGETVVLWLHAGWEELGLDKFVKGQDTLEVEIVLRDMVGREAQRVMFTDTVRRTSRSDASVHPRVPLRVRVVDERGGPAAGAEVELRHATLGVSVQQVDAEGTFTVSLPAHRSTHTERWTPHYVTVSRRGSSSCTFALEVRPEDAYDVTVRLAPAPPLPRWEITSTWSGVLNLNRARISDDGRVAALVDFHSIIPSGVDRTTYVAQAGLHVFSAFDGHLWSHPLGGETPAVAVDPTGALIAAPIDLPDGPSGIALFDRSGTLLRTLGHPVLASLRRPDGPRNGTIREVAMSPDAATLIAGTIAGHVIAWDLATDRVLWERRFPDQIREIRFLDDGILLGGGHGYLYSLTADGSVRWRTFIGAFPIALAVDEDHIAAAGKQSTSLILMNRDGEVLWEHETTSATHDIDFSPDGRLVLARSSAGQYRSVLLTVEGEILGTLPDGEPGAFLSDSRTLLLSGHVMTEATGDIGSIWIAAGDVSGTIGWRRDDLATTVHRGPTGGLVWVSPDDRHAIVATGEFVFTLRRVD